METKKLGDIAKIYTGARISRYQENTKKQPIIEKKHYQNEPQIKQEEVSKDLNKKFYSQKNDIILPIHDPENIFQINKPNIIIPMNYLIIRTNEKYNPKYVYYLLKIKLLKKEMEILTEGTTLRIIKTPNLKEIKIPLIEEKKQEQIAKILELIEKRKKLLKKQDEIYEKIEKTILNKTLEE